LTLLSRTTALKAKKLAIGHKPADMMTQAVRVATNPYLVFEIRRDHLLDDTLEQVSLSLKDLKKPLKIKYVGGGEEGLDMGGVQKEFFQQIMELIFDVEKGMFEYAEETGTFWIKGSSLEPEREFELVGILIGLAIYNGVILDMQLPLVLYKKLLGIQPELIDLMQSQPSLGNGLKALLDFEGDVAELEMCFQVNENQYGHVATVDLVKDAENVIVNNKNRHLYVDLYVRHILDTSVAKQFEALHRGLHFVCGGPAIKLFSPDELELVVCGSPNLDFKELEAGTTYEGGFTKESEVVVWLWELVHAMDSENQRSFLHYVTGSGRVPIKGLSTLKMVIQQNGEHSDRLPTALTCFSRLLLPNYTNRERLKDRLFLAMEHGKGFGLA
jgi:ubiquitin-protein ligase E3 A